MNLMIPSWKQLKEQAIGLKSNPFSKAVLQIASLYIFTTALLLAILSVGLYFFLLEEIREDQLSNNLENPLHSQLLIAEEMHIRNTILLSDIFAIVAITVIGLLLAKKTMTPIDNNYQSQKRFISEVSHELRTPLTIMQAGLELALNNKKKNTKYIPLLKSNLEEVQRMSKLVNKLMLVIRHNSHYSGKIRSSS